MLCYLSTTSGAMDREMGDLNVFQLHRSKFVYFGFFNIVITIFVYRGLFSVQNTVK